MFETLIIVFVLTGAVPENSRVIEVQSVAISLIDDVELAFEEAGRLEQLEVAVGDVVQAGELLGKQSDAAAKLEVQRMQVQVAIAKVEAANELQLNLQKKSLSLAEDELGRALRSIEQFPQSVSDTELNRNRFAVDEAQMRIEQAEYDLRMKELELQLRESELAIAEEKLNRRELRAPSQGRIVELEPRVGEWLQPGQPLVRMIRMDRVLAEGFVSEDSGQVLPGQPVELTLKDATGADLIFTGRVTFVDPEINPITGQFRLRAEIENPDETLRPGHQPTMKILPQPREQSADAPAPRS